ncbi:MAG: hypothetical protein GY772_04670, partial [bacterium]|nr:hypothetical protein [bacterium]
MEMEAGTQVVEMEVSEALPQVEVVPRVEEGVDFGGSEEEEEEEGAEEYLVEDDRVAKELAGSGSVLRVEEPSLDAAAQEEFWRWRDECRRVAETSPEMRSIVEGAADGTVVVPVGDMKVALCSTNCKRVWQSKRALLLQLLALWPFRGQDRVRLYLVDLNEDDELWEYVFENCRMALRLGLLQYSRRPCKYWHCSSAKNT